MEKNTAIREKKNAYVIRYDMTSLYLKVHIRNIRIIISIHESIYLLRYNQIRKLQIYIYLFSFQHFEHYRSLIMVYKRHAK